MRHRLTPFGFWATFLVTVIIETRWSASVRAQDAAPVPDGRFRAEVDPQESKLRAKTGLAIDQLPRNLAVKKLSELHGLPIKLDEKALAAAGVKLDVPVTVSFRNYTLRAALFHVLGNDDLHFTFNGKVLTVTTAPPDAPEAAAGVRLVHPPAVVVANSRISLGFELRMRRDGSFAMAALNGVQIECVPAADIDAAEAGPPV